MQKIILITSKYEDKKNSKIKKKIYAGNWCIKNPQNDIIYDWNLNNNFEKNYDYLNKIMQKFGKILSKKLNQLHKIDKDPRFWEILLFPWLTYYIPAQFYRWKIVKDIVAKNKNLYVYKPNLIKYPPVTDSLEFYEGITNSDYLNEVFFGRIIDFLIKKKKISKIFLKDKTKIPNDIKKYSIPRKSNNIKEKIKKISSFIISKIYKEKKILICEGLISSQDLIELNLKLNQAPIFSKRVFNKQYYLSTISNLKTRKDLRKKISLDEKKFDDFENFLSIYIMEDMPKCLLEGFGPLNKMVNKINLYPKYAVVFHDHYHNELFKFWYANNLKSIKLIICAHGAAMQPKPAHFGIESKIANKKVSYVNDDECPIRTRVKLPFPQLIRYKRKNPKFLIFSTYTPEYYPCRYGVSNNTFATNRNYEDLLLLKKYLDKKIFSQLKISNKLSNSKSIKNLNNLFYGKKNINNIPFSKQINSAKLMICTYPQTTFLESVASGPTLALFNYKDWIFTKNNMKIYDKLIYNNIFFESAEELSFFINKKWENIDIWWSEIKKKKIIDEYLSLFQEDPNYLKEWKNFLRTLV